ncbi:MAG: Rpn family recombination-promoting nuclease/putative transposase [Treponema sp.]|jgi:predicted transposase/invertase (TIGR01784 family)|nr:Rpn family recombination-promoting nuclease/putative transposase [Treponema sp.]
MTSERLNPLNDFIFLKIMGEKGDEEQLLSFLNAVLNRPENQKLLSVEIMSNTTLPADIIGGKSCILDVLAELENGDRINIEVQLRNPGNMDRRSLFYWSREFNKGISAGEKYREVPNVIAINIVGYEFLPQVPDFHTTFHIWEDRHREIMLTDALEIHFLDMIKFRSLEGRDVTNNVLHRWLTYLDKRSPKKLVEEVIKMDIAIQKAEERLRTISQDAESLRLYEIREKALYDWNSGIDFAERKGKEEGIKIGEQKGELKIVNLLKSGKSPEEIIKLTENKYKENNQ